MGLYRMEALGLRNLQTGEFFDPFELGVTEPTPLNTGPRLAPLNTVSSDVTLSTPQVFERHQVNGRIIVTQGAFGQILIRDNFVDASGGTYASQKGVVEVHPNTGAEVIIEHNDLKGKVGMLGVTSRRFVARRNRIHHTEDAFRVSNVNGTGSALNTSILANYMSDMIMVTPDPYNTRSDNKTHSDVIQVEGGDGLQIIGNTLRAYNTTDGTSNVNWVQDADPWLPVAPGTAGASAHPQALSGVMLTKAGSLADITNLRINENWFYGGEVGINGGSSTNATLTGEALRNRFDQTQWRALHTIDLDSTATGFIAPGQDDPTNPGVNIYMSGGAVNVRRNQ